jgi:sugar phosphate isomerase/epimerase
MGGMPNFFSSEQSALPGPCSRRRFCQSTIQIALTGAFLSATLLRGQPATKGKRRMTIALTPGSIGVSANQTETIALAARHGFESVEPFGSFLASLDGQQIADLVQDLKSRGLVWAAAGLPVNFRQDQTRFDEDLKRLPKIAAALQKAGVRRVGTWLSPSHDSLTYLQNFRRHSSRLRLTAEILNDHGQKLGLEYVGTQTLRHARKFSFVHTLTETKELIAEIGAGNVGFVLDSWHWWTAGETAADILALNNEEVISVDLNDAPSGVPIEQQIDGRRELPMATGVIDANAFLNALQQIGYDGPVRAEPFNRTLNALDNEAACAATINAMRKAFALIEA